MSEPQKFRSAFHGFHREDVVRYLEYINAKHAAQVTQLTNEAEYLREKLDAMPDVSALELERDTLRAQLTELEVRYNALEAQLNQSPAAPTMEQELEVYRRAERTERMARERSELIYHQAGNVLTEAAGKVSAFSGKVTPLAEDILSRLQELVSAVGDGKDALKDALDLIATLKPEQD